MELIADSAALNSRVTAWIIFLIQWLMKWLRVPGSSNAFQPEVATGTSDENAIQNTVKNVGE